MKIRSITLHNVRRFQAVTARIQDIGDGITTICAPNESGKSTFFDALHALFFYPYGGQSQEIKSLQPYSKGAVEISADIEDDQGKPWRIEKRYLSSKAAIITDLSSGRIHAQADEAEEWIRTLIGADMHGPTGLLWVRQGITGFGPDGSGTREKTEREKLRETRQGLMSSIAGQIDNVTGGRRMDAIMHACEADLEALATKTGQPKAGGEWSKAQRRLKELEEEEQKLATQAGELHDALKEQAKLKRLLREADDPEALRLREENITEARKKLEAANQHATRIDDTKRDLRLSELEAKEHSEKLESADTAKESKLRADEAARLAGLAAQEAQDEASERKEAMEDARGLHQTAQTATRAARTKLAEAQQIHEAIRAKKRRGEINDLLTKIASHEKRRKEQKALARNNPLTPEVLAELEDKAREVSTARAMRDATSASLRITYTGDTRLQENSEDIPGDEGISLTRHMEITMPGIGQLALAPAAQRTEGADLEELENTLNTRLEDLGIQTPEQARKLARERQEALNSEELAKQAIETLVPNGTEALQRELDNLPEIEPAAEEQPAQDIAQLQSKVETCETTEQDAASELERLRELHTEAAALATAADTEWRVAKEQAGAIPESILDEETYAAEQELLAAAHRKTNEIKGALETLEQTAPDIEAARAELERLTSAKENAEKERISQQNKLHELGGIIRARAEDDVETRLSETRGELEDAAAREARYRFEVQALTELKDHLDAARREARDAYFEPVKKEIAPLLSMLHENAVIEMDSDTMLPARIVRDGVAEEIDVLSGGAAEQIAILTRLAFARLYAKSGKQVPIILDDALVHSDDERIVTMFTALTRSAKDQQIIVFSCRTRAFSELGGTRTSIETDSSLSAA